MLVLDTSAILAALDRTDPAHTSVLTTMRADRSARIVPVGILAEATYMLDVRIGAEAVLAFLRDLDSGALSPDCGDGDFGRVRELVDRYADLPLGYADAAVIACAERRTAPVLSIDDRDFTVVAREGLFTLADLG